MDRVREWWQSYEHSGAPSFVLHMKLKALKNDLKVWNWEVFGILSFRKSALMQELSSFDALDEGGILNVEGEERKLVIFEELDRLIELEEIS